MVTLRNTVEYSTDAENQLLDIYNYILDDTKSKNQAKSVIRGIDEAIYSAALFPTKHRIEENYKNRNVRFTVKWKYKIVFEILDNCIYVLQVFHTSQNPQKLKK